MAHRMYYGAVRLGQGHLPSCPPHGAMGHGLNPDLFCTHAQAPGHVEGGGLGLPRCEGYQVTALELRMQGRAGPRGLIAYSERCWIRDLPGRCSIGTRDQA